MTETLAQAIAREGSPVELLRNQNWPAFTFPVAPEFTNWRDEQRAWRETAVLYDQSHHMAELMVEGPDAARLLTGLAINSFAKFAVDQAKQFVPTSYDGHVIGDGILFHLQANSLVFVGRAPSANWIQFHAATGKYDVNLTWLPPGAKLFPVIVAG